MSERKLVRARAKAVEYLPEWAKCCDAAIDACQSWPEMIVDLGDTVHVGDGDMRCIFCKTSYPEMIGVLDTADNQYAELPLLDLDEGRFEP